MDNVPAHKPREEDSVERIADLLRSAGAWLRLAADSLEDGKRAEARSMASLGLLGAQDTPDRIAALQAREGRSQ